MKHISIAIVGATASALCLGVLLRRYDIRAECCTYAAQVQHLSRANDSAKVR